MKKSLPIILAMIGVSILSLLVFLRLEAEKEELVEWRKMNSLVEESRYSLISADVFLDSALATHSGYQDVVDMAKDQKNQFQEAMLELSAWRKSLDEAEPDFFKSFSVSDYQIEFLPILNKIRLFISDHGYFRGTVNNRAPLTNQKE